MLQQHFHRAMYALAIVIRLNQAGQQKRRELAEHLGLGIDYVEQILLQLKRAGLIAIDRGTYGGARLVVEPDKLTIAKIFKAVGLDFGTKQANGTHSRRGAMRISENFLRNMSATIDERLKRQDLEALASARKAD